MVKRQPSRKAKASHPHGVKRGGELAVDKLNKLKIVFNNDREELLRVYNTGGSIVKQMNKKHDYICPQLKMSGTIAITRLLGEGSFGKVFEIKIKGTNAVYVLKKPLSDASPQAESLCLIDKNKEFHMNGGTIRRLNIPPGSYICENELYSEYMIGLLATNIKPNINILSVLDFATCYSPTVKQYIFMEKIDSDLITALHKEIMTDEDIHSIVLQLLVTIKLYNQYKIQHNDLHTGNVFIKKIKNNTLVNGKNVGQYTHLAYKVSGRVIYVPVKKYLVKIGDWGMSCKYSDPMILNKNVMEGRITTPNWYCPISDVLFSLIDMSIEIGESGMPVNQLVEDILNYATGDDWLYNQNRVFDYTKQRLVLKNLYDKTSTGVYKTVDDVLFSPKSPVSAYLEKPKGTILNL
jgi:serine/threonine protein kinase